MPRNRIADIILSFLFTFATLLVVLRIAGSYYQESIKNRTASSFSMSDITSEDDKIMLGLWYEENGDLQNSLKVFRELYKTTGAQIYQLKAIHLSLLLNKNIPSVSKELSALYLKEPNNKDILKLILTLHLMQNKFDLANIEATKLSQISSDDTDLEIASDAFLYSNEPNKALDLLQRVYDKTGREDIVLRMATILFDVYGDSNQAIKLLQEHISRYGSNKDVEQKIEKIQKTKIENRGKI